MRNNYIKKTLSNGVKLYLYLDKNMKQCYVDYMVNYGSMGKWYDFYLDDKHYHVLPGCAHFLEHMLGEHSKYGDFYKYMASKKYYKNGGTSDIMTHYFFRGTEDILESIEKIINVIDDPVFTKEDVEETKYAIAEETKRTRNNKFSLLSCLLQRNLFKDLNLYDETISLIGNEETTYKIDYDMLKACYDAFYYDENKTLLIAGNFDEKEITNYVENIYSKLKPHKKRVKEYKYDNLDKVKKEYDNYNFSTNDDEVGIIFKEYNKKYSKKEVYYYLYFISDVIFSDESKFVQRLKKENILTEMDWFKEQFIYDDLYFFFIIASVKDSEKFKDELLRELKNIKFKEKDFELYIKDYISNHALKVDYKYDQFQSFAFRKRFSDDFDDIDFLKTLTFDKFLEFYKTLDFDNYVVGVISDKK
ncbi:MAG: insulinase family protein [Bacilli bacterium]|nr:insulinase family protein [Bacilli bacterium]